MASRAETWRRRLVGFPVASSLILLAVLVSATVMMTVGWYVQLVHYPAFLSIQPSMFAAFHSAHAMGTGMVVVPAMVGELIGSILLVADRPPKIGQGEALLGLALALIAWGCTFGLSVPLHAKLANGHDAATIRSLVATNWPRTLAWTAHAGLCVWQAARLLAR